MYEFLFPAQEPVFQRRLSFQKKLESLSAGRLKKTQTKEKSYFKEFFSHSQKPNFTSYQQCFLQAKGLIKQKKLEKIVPVFPEVFYKPLSVLKFLQKLFKKTSFLEGYLYGFWNQDSGMLGFTPELLFYLQADSFWTMALAGTAPQNSLSLLKDPKQVKEHDFVVKGLKKSLKGFINWKSVERREMLFPPLKHLRTDLKGVFNRTDVPFESLCQLLHPSPAVGGFPKKTAQEWLEWHSSQKNRLFYAAPFGLLKSQKEAFCLIALRNLQWNQKESFIFSGAGWIAESSLQEEWRELGLKREQVKSFFK